MHCWKHIVVQAKATEFGEWHFKSKQRVVSPPPGKTNVYDNQSACLLKIWVHYYPLTCIPSTGRSAWALLQGEHKEALLAAQGSGNDSHGPRHVLDWVCHETKICYSPAHLGPTDCFGMSTTVDAMAFLQAAVLLILVTTFAVLRCLCIRVRCRPTGNTSNWKCSGHWWWCINWLE